MDDPNLNQVPDSKSDSARKLLVFFTKPWVLILIILLFLTSFITYSVNQIMNALLHSRPEVVVPNLERRGLLEVLEEVSALNLSLAEDGIEYDETVPAGTILRQHPPSGMQVRAGRTVRVIISKGGRVVFVPTVVGVPLAEAQSKLALEGLQLGAVTELFSPDVPSRTTVSQDPSSGTVVTRGALVDLTVSKGPPPAGAPIALDFLGANIEQVQRWCSQEGIKLDLKEKPTAVGSTGTVVEQDPLGGQPLIYGKLKVTIVPLMAFQEGYRFTYVVPSDEGEVVVRIKARNMEGETIVYDGKHQGGDRIEFPMKIESTTRARIYLNDRLKDERVIEP